MTSMFLEKLIARHNLGENIVDLSLDSAFKKFFLDANNKYYLAYLIYFLTGLSTNYSVRHLKYNESKVKMISDINVYVRKKTIILSTFYDFNNVNLKNNKLVIGNNYIKKEKYITKINFIRSDEKKLCYDNIDKTTKNYYINLNYLEILYKRHRISKKEKKLIILVEREKKILINLFKNDIYMNDILNNINNYSTDKNFILEYDYEIYIKDNRK